MWPRLAVANSKGRELQKDLPPLAVSP